MRGQLLGWLGSAAYGKLDWDDGNIRLTIKPKESLFKIKYWEPSPIKGSNLWIWKRKAKILLPEEIVQDCKDFEKLGDDLLRLLEEGGDYEYKRQEGKK